MGHIQDLWYSPGADGKDRPTARHGHGKRWKVRYQAPDGAEKSKAFSRKVDAERFLTQAEHDRLTGVYRDPAAGKVTLGQYAAQWLAAQGFDPVTREAVESRVRLHILPVLGSKRLAELADRPSLVQAWLATLRLAPSTARKVFSHLNTIMLAAMTDGQVTRNPCKAPGVRPPRPVRRRVSPWTPEQSAAVRAALPERFRAIVDAGAGLGLRQSELFGLSVEEIEFLPGRVVHVRQQVKLVAGRPHFAAPKGGKERTVPLAAQTSLALAAHIERHAAAVTLAWHEPGTRRHGKPHTATLLFTTEQGRAVARHAFTERVWRPALRETGLADERANGCHMLRHLYASTLVAHGVDVRTVAEYLGHSDGGALVLGTYSHLMPDAEDRARRAVEDALSAGAPKTDLAQDS